MVSLKHCLHAGFTCADTLAWNVLANFQGDGIPSKGENCTQRPRCQKLHVSTCIELLLCRSICRNDNIPKPFSVSTLQCFANACMKMLYIATGSLTLIAGNFTSLHIHYCYNEGSSEVGGNHSDQQYPFPQDGC